jgi:hypothetical protein
LDLRESTSFRDSILGLDPGLLNSFAALKNAFPPIPSSAATSIALGSLLSSNPSKYGCLSAYYGVILF